MKYVQLTFIRVFITDWPSMLGVLGLSASAEAVYRALLEEPRSSIEELVTNLALPETDVCAALDELVRHCLVRESRDVPGKLRVVRPDVGLEVLLRRHEADLAQRRRQLDDAKTEIAGLVASSASSEQRGDHSDVTERLLGLDAIQARLEVLARDLQKECLSVMPGGAQSPASLNASSSLDERALAAGIKILTLFQESVRNDPATHAYAQWLTNLGGDVRTAPILPTRMLIFDRRIAVIPIDPDDTKLGALCTAEMAIVRFMVSIFETAWNTAVPLGACAQEDAATGLTALDRQILIMLGKGLTDEAVANRLGVSGRTVRRQVASIMERLNASSRFEAGLKAAQRGWI
jgi:DNA-binding CsgD family transcriptional regulator/sugar-specific transcriptional regulator TrmB